MKNYLSVFLLCFLISFPALSALWSENSVSFLRGENYELGNEKRTIYTYEHASGWKYGDNFMFFDVTDPFAGTGRGATQVYGEWSPRFSIGKILNFYNKDRIVQDILLAATVEHGRSGVISRAFLYGLGFDFKIPKFAFFKYNIYVRNTIDTVGTTFQSTFSWMIPFGFSKVKFQFQGYLDIVHGQEGTGSSIIESHWHTAPQLLLDIGNFWNASNAIWAGFEYQYWSRKFGGSSNPVENNLQLMAKWVF